MHKSIKTVMTLLFIYITAYVAIKNIKPELINSNDGPVAAYNALFYPLRFIDSRKPAYFWCSLGGLKSINVKFDWVNEGNGYIYIIWNGIESRAGFIGNFKEHEGKNVTIKFSYLLKTYDDFANHQLPVIISVE